MLTHPLFLWVLSLANQVGPSGPTLVKPMLSFQGNLLLCAPRSVFQENLPHYFAMSGVFFTRFRIFNPVSGSWQPMVPLIITCLPSCSLVTEQQIQLCIITGWPILYLYQQVVSDILQKSFQLFVSCHVALPADVRAVAVPYENETLMGHWFCRFLPCADSETSQKASWKQFGLAPWLLPSLYFCFKRFHWIS